MQISSADYQRFKIVLEKQSGILLGENKQYLVASRLSNLLKDNNLDSFSQLIEQISTVRGNQLLKQVVDRMTTNETLWFRDRYPFDYLKTNIIPALKSSKRRIRIWCAACSTGQEPYSVAMQLADMGILTEVEIVATDLSERVLKKAQEGIYQQIELNRGLSQVNLKKYLSPLDDGTWQVKPQMRNKIRFQPLNLLTTPYLLGSFDVIFCRNVLIYFSGENKSQVLKGLVDKLNPNAYLFLGASEALTRDTQGLTMVRCNPGLVYQKQISG